MKTYKLPFKEFIKPNFLFYRASQTIKQIKPHLLGIKILDVGCGTGHVSEFLQRQGFKVVTTDIEDLSKIKTIKPVVFNGVKLPFKDNEFETALLLTVFHHAKEPEELLKDIFRVSKRVILIEDIYETRIEKIKMKVLDSIFNFEFFGHPHNNKKDSEWKEFFKKNKYELIETDYWITKTPIGSIRQALYVIERS